MIDNNCRHLLVREDKAHDSEVRDVKSRPVSSRLVLTELSSPLGSTGLVFHFLD